jgi:hypothetical protein
VEEGWGMRKEKGEVCERKKEESGKIKKKLRYSKRD